MNAEELVRLYRRVGAVIALIRFNYRRGFRPAMTLESKQQVGLRRRFLVQERDMIETALKDTGGRVSGPTGAAVKLGLARSTLESKIRSLKISKNRFKA